MTAAPFSKFVALLVVLAGLRTTLIAFPPEAAGTYGLFGDGSRNPMIRGQITVTATGAFSGLVNLGYMESTSYLDAQSAQHVFSYPVMSPITGQFDSAGSALLVLSAAPYGDTRETLSLEYFAQTQHIHGTDTVSLKTEAQIRGSFDAFKVVPAGPRAGSYTVAFQPTSRSEKAPEGSGWAAVTVKPNGRVLLRGRLATGRPFSMSSLLRAGGEFWFDGDREFSHMFQRSPVGRFTAVKLIEGLSGVVTIIKSPTENAVEGTLKWSYHKRNWFHFNEVFFASELAVNGSLYAPPQPGKLIFGFDGDIPRNNRVPIEVTLAGAGLAEPQMTGFSLVVRDGATQAVNLTAPLIAMQFNVADAAAGGVIGGTFQGKLQFAGETKQRSVSGVILQKQNIGVGFFYRSGRRSPSDRELHHGAPKQLAAIVATRQGFEP